MITLLADVHALITHFRIVLVIEVGRAFIVDRARHLVFGRARNHHKSCGEQNSEASHEPLVSI